MNIVVEPTAKVASNINDRDLNNPTTDGVITRASDAYTVALAKTASVYTPHDADKERLTIAVPQCMARELYKMLKGDYPKGFVEVVTVESPQQHIPGVDPCPLVQLIED